MKDIKSLFETAKSSGRTSDVSAYVEAVDQLFESNPQDFISNVEYIISSGYGAKKFISFVEKYGLPIVAYEPVMEYLSETVDRGRAFGKPVTEQVELMEYLEAFKTRYPNCFMMFEGIMNDEYFEEKSNSKLDVAYRAAVNVENNHPIKIIYDLRDNTITMTGMDYKKKHHGVEVSPETIAKNAADAQKVIRKNGNMDFQSKGRIKAVIDMVTGERIKHEITCEGIFKMGARRKFKVKEGEMETTPSFKTTFWPKGDKVFIGHSAELARRVISSEISAKENLELPEGRQRGAKAHSIQKAISSKTRLLLEADPKTLTAERIVKDFEAIKATLKSKDAMLALSKSDVEVIRGNVDNIIKRYVDLHPETEKSHEEEKKSKKKMKALKFGINLALDVIDKGIKTSGTKRDYKKESVLDSTYVAAYYNISESGIQGRNVLTGMISLFEEAAIPDLLISASSINEQAIDDAFWFFKEYAECDATLNQWLTEASADVIPPNHDAPYLTEIAMNSLSNIVRDCQKRNQDVYREAMLIGDDQAMMEYEDYELKAIEDLISFREYQMLFLDGQAQMKCFNEVMSLYEELDGLIPENECCFNEATNPRNRTIKEIAARLNQLAKQAAKYVRAEIDNGVFIKVGVPYNVIASYGTKKGPGTGFTGVNGLIKKNMDDISDFSEEWMENIFLFIQFEIKSSSIKADMDKARSLIYKALKPLIEDEKIKGFQSLKYVGDYSCWIAFKVGKTYAVGDSDIGMFESVSQIEEEVSDQVIPMMALPNGQIVEAKWIVNTRNKKTGAVPGYLGNNHNLGWGEDEGGSGKDKSSEDSGDETEPTLDDFKRPSAAADDTSSDTTSGEDDSSSMPATPEDDKRAINNYYYYTYNNSMNKNSNSFNKTQKDDHSSKDDHSVRSHSDDHSIRTKQDDHSTGKGSIPDDVDGGRPADKPDYTDPDDEYKSYGEAAGFRSGATWDKECRIFDKLFKVDLNKLGDVHSPDKKISITIGDKKFTFTSTLGNVPGKEEKLANYAQVPTAVHQFNVHKSRITEDKIGIDRCIVHYIKLRDPEFDPDSGINVAIKNYKVESKNIVFKLYGEIGLTFTSTIDNGATFVVLIDEDLNCRDGDKSILITEAVGDADNMKPKSDHPIKDTFQDIDRETAKVQQKAKKKIQDVQNVGRAAMKPINRTKQWLTKMVLDWKDRDENAMKEKLADPHARNNLFTALRTCIKYGALAKAGLLLNPIFLGISILNRSNKKSKEFRIRNEMIGELKTEIKIIDEKIKDADGRDNNAKYKLIRLKNEINKKLLRVGGTKEFKKII